MENKLILNLRLEEVEDQKKMFALMNLALKKLRQFRLSNIDVEYFELRLHRTNLLTPSKEAYLKIDADNRTFIGSETAGRWDDAVLNVCERLRQRFLFGDQAILLEA